MNPFSNLNTEEQKRTSEYLRKSQKSSKELSSQPINVKRLQGMPVPCTRPTKTEIPTYPATTPLLLLNHKRTRFQT